jgi:uncharacterized membrane protein YfcA
MILNFITIPIIFLFTIICEIIDSGLGMLYGTILSPVLIILGFNPLIVVPSILLSQAVGGFIASIFHHKKGNALLFSKSSDSKTAWIIIICGIVATIFAVLVAVNISGIFL